MENLRKALDGTGGRNTLSITLPASYWYLQHFDFSKVGMGIEIRPSPFVSFVPDAVHVIGHNVEERDNLRKALDGTGGRNTLSITLPASYWYLQHFDLKELAKPCLISVRLVWALR
jgi:GH18 family chitinase